jgi:hypothetical protein
MTMLRFRQWNGEWRGTLDMRLHRFDSEEK